MSFGSEFKTVAKTVGDAIWPSPSRSKVFVENFGRGVSWALILLLALAIPSLALSFVSQDIGISVSADDLAKSAVLLAIATSGSFLNFVIDASAFEQSTFFLDIGATPTLITLVIGYLAFRAGTKIKEFRNSTDSIGQLSGFSALGLGVGFAGTLFGASLIASGFVLDFGVAKLAPMSLSSLLWAFFVVALPAWLGAKRSASRKAVSAWRWAYSALRTFGVFYSVLLGVVALTLLVYTIIAPVFTFSSPPVTATSGPGLNGWFILGSVVLFLLFLPTLLFNVFAVAMGAEYSYQVDFLGLNILQLAEAFSFLENNPFIPTSSGISVLSTLGIWAFLAVIVAVILTALISGVAATGKVSFDVVFRRDIFAGLVVVFFVGFVLKTITTFTAVWTNRGLPLNEVKEGLLPLQEGSASLGLTTASFGLVLAVIALFMVAGGSKAAAFIQESFPRLVSTLSGRKLESDIDRSIFSMFFGRLVATFAALAIVIPLGIATIERSWAWIDNPGNKFREVATLVETGELEEVKKFFSQNSDEDLNWLPDEVLESARPSSDSRESVVVTNGSFNRKGEAQPWEIGQLDALGKVSWKTESDPVVLNLGSIWEVTDHLRYIQHPNYTATADRLNMNISYGEFASDAGLSDIFVNGVSVKSGTYSAIPGSYLVKTPGFKLIAPTEKVFVTNGSEMVFTAEEKPLLSANAESVLDKEIDRLAQACGRFTSLDNPRCFTFEEIYKNRTPVGAAPVEDYFAIKTGEFKVGRTSCSGAAVDGLLSASTVERFEACSTAMTFEVTYFESKIQVSDVFVTQTFNACPGLSIPCNRTRQVKTGTKETEVIGDRIGRGTMASSVTFVVDTKGTLRDDGSFVIIDRFVPPVYNIEAPVAKEPVAEPLKLLGYYKDLEALLRAHPTADLGDGYVVSKRLDLYVWNGRQWTLVGKR